jgi:hypothetical protein
MDRVRDSVGRVGHTSVCAGRGLRDDVHLT